MSLDPLIKRLLPLKTRALTREIAKLQLPLDRADALYAQIIALKRQRFGAKRRAQIRRAQWQALLSSVRTEAEIIKRLLRHHQAKPEPQPARITALEMYLLVLTELRARIHTARSAPGMALPAHPPNKGHDWTAWVPPHIKERVLMAFADIPLGPRERRKIPFTPTQPAPPANSTKEDNHETQTPQDPT